MPTGISRALKLACPFETWAVPKTVVPLATVTEPDVAGAPPWVAWTLTVKVTSWPNTALAGWVL